MGVIKTDPSNSKWDVAAVGLALMLLLLGIVLIAKDRSRLVELIIRTTLAIAAGYAGVKLSGSVEAVIGKAVTATGTIALVLIIYFFNPAWTPRDDEPGPGKPPPNTPPEEPKTQDK